MLILGSYKVGMYVQKGVTLQSRGMTFIIKCFCHKMWTVRVFLKFSGFHKYVLEYATAAMMTWYNIVVGGSDPQG